MNRKRDDFECNDHEDNGPGPITKKIKSPLPAVDQLNLNNRNDETILLNTKQLTYAKDTNIVEQNGLIKMAMTSNLPPQVLKIIFSNENEFSFLNFKYLKKNF